MSKLPFTKKFKKLSHLCWGWYTLDQNVPLRLIQYQNLPKGVITDYSQLELILMIFKYQ